MAINSKPVPILLDNIENLIDSIFEGSIEESGSGLVTFSLPKVYVLPTYPSDTFKTSRIEDHTTKPTKTRIAPKFTTPPGLATLDALEIRFPRNFDNKIEPISEIYSNSHKKYASFFIFLIITFL